MGKVFLIEPDEQLSFELLPGVEIVYRRPTQSERAAWGRMCTRNGYMDDGKLAQVTLKHCVLDWKGIYSKKAGKEEPFSQKALMRLPQEHLVRLIERLGISDDVLEDEDTQEKN